MKKNLEKVFASASIVVAIVLIMILLVTSFGGIQVEEFESKLVRGLMVALAVIYFILAITSLVLIFVNSDVVKEIIIRSQPNGSTRASISVVRKLVRSTVKEVDGVKCTKVALVSNEYGVRLKVEVKVEDRDIVETETYVRTALEDAFKAVFGFRFHSIEIKVTTLKSKYAVNKAELKQKADKIIEEKKAEESEAKVELTDDEQQEMVVPTEDIVPVEHVPEDEEAVEVEDKVDNAEDKAEEKIEDKEDDKDDVIDPLFSQDVKEESVEDSEIKK